MDDVHEGLLAPDENPTTLGKFLVYLDKATNGFNVEEEVQRITTETAGAKRLIDGLIIQSGLPSELELNIIYWKNFLGTRIVNYKREKLPPADIVKLGLRENELPVLNDTFETVYQQILRLQEDWGMGRNSLKIGDPQSRQTLALDMTALSLVMQRKIKTELPKLGGRIDVYPTLYYDLRQVAGLTEGTRWSSDNWGSNFVDNDSQLETSAKLLAFRWGVNEYIGQQNQGFITTAPQYPNIQAKLKSTGVDENSLDPLRWLSGLELPDRTLIGDKVFRDNPNERFANWNLLARKDMQPVIKYFYQNLGVISLVKEAMA